MKVTAYVFVMKDGYPVRLAPGDTVPEGVEVTNPAVLDESEAPAEDPVTDEDADADKAEDAPAEAPAPAPRKRPAKKAADSE